MKKNTIILIVILVILMLLSFGIILIYNKNIDSSVKTPEIPKQEVIEKEEPEEIEEGWELTLLNDHNRHYLLKELINDYIIYVKNSDIKVYDIVLDEFDNSINNIFYNKTYHADTVSYIRLNDRITKYNVKGYLNTVSMGEIGSQTNFDVTIFLDNTNMTYQLALQYDYEKNISEIPNNYTNKYVMKSVSNQYIASLYFSNLKDKILRKNENLSNIIENYDNIEKLDEIVNQSINTYQIDEKNGNMILKIKDKNNNQYIFNIKSVLNYTVKIY